VVGCRVVGIDLDSVGIGWLVLSRWRVVAMIEEVLVDFHLWEISVRPDDGGRMVMKIVKRGCMESLMVKDSRRGVGFRSRFRRWCSIGDVVSSLVLIAGRGVFVIGAGSGAMITVGLSGAGRVWALACKVAGASTVIANDIGRGSG
jgi:hypothetical protein